MKFATTKQRIIQYLDFKDIKIKDFFQQTEIKRGFLDADKLESSVSDIFITKIIAKYEDLNPIWLLTGNGSMLKTENEHSEVTSETSQQKIAMLEEMIEGFKASIKDKDFIIEMLRDENARLKKQIDPDVNKSA